MQLVPNDLSAEGWLEQARDLADRLKKQYRVDRCKDVDKVTAWVADENFQRAYEYLIERRQQVKALIARMDA